MTAYRGDKLVIARLDGEGEMWKLNPADVMVMLEALRYYDEAVFEGGRERGSGRARKIGKILATLLREKEPDWAS